MVQPGTNVVNCDETAADVLVMPDKSVETDANGALIGVDGFIVAACSNNGLRETVGTSAGVHNDDELTDNGIDVSDEVD